ncbi:hypothetical protein ACFU6I_41100 [Streptomyces sp. NPDC057486]|uniref:hypothetical protein n=1 Tax=Streptomyces sp. NPDC057486 TaxID=3346145 RepID=UPI00367D15CE
MEETPSPSVPKVVTTADARKGFADLLDFVQSTGDSVAIRRYTTVVAHLVPEPPADDAPAYSLAQVLQALDADDFRTEPGRISVATACELLERGITRIEDWRQWRRAAVAGGRSADLDDSRRPGRSAQQRSSGDHRGHQGEVEGRDAESRCSSQHPAAR